MTRIGIVGYGLRGGLAHLAHRPDEGFVVVGLADPSPEAQAKFRSRFPEARSVESVEALLGLNLDAALVLSPDPLHHAHALRFLQQGVAVFLEKPMAITTEQCDEILAAARQPGRKLYVGHNMRHFPVVRQMKAWIDAGKIGEVKAAWCRHFVSYGGGAYFMDWHADRRNTTGLLLQKGAHDIDVLHYLCGAYSRRAVGMGGLTLFGGIDRRRPPGTDYRVDFSEVDFWPPSAIPHLNPVVDVEDLNMVLMELDSGVLASYQQCHYTPDAWRNYTVIGTEGRIENFGDVPGNGVVRLWNRFRFGHDPAGDESVVIPPLAGSHGGADPPLIDEFLGYVTGRIERTETSPEAARMAVATGVAATESIRRGSIPIDVPPLPFDN